MKTNQLKNLLPYLKQDWNQHLKSCPGNKNIIMAWFIFKLSAFLSTFLALALCLASAHNHNIVFFCFQTCSGFVRGPPNTSPQLVTFQQDFKKGALLTIVSMAYQRGKIMVTIKILKAFAVMMWISLILWVVNTWVHWSELYNSFCFDFSYSPLYFSCRCYSSTNTRIHSHLLFKFINHTKV